MNKFCWLISNLVPLSTLNVKMQISVWEKESFYAPKDVIIIGSGLTGLWCAWHLKKKKPSLSITIVERGIIPTGASTRNAGFACFGSITELLEDAARSGEDNMLALVEMRYKGLQQIRRVFAKKEIDFDRCGGYELFTDKSQLHKKELEEKIAWLNKKLRKIVKDEKIFHLADKKIRAFGFENVIHLAENRLEGYLHAGKLCQALLQAVQSMGVTVLNATEITGYEKIGTQVALYTNQHMHLVAENLVICTNAFAKNLLPDLDIVPARGQVLLTTPIPGLPFKGTFHYDEGFYYFRNLGNRVLLGGARNSALEEETTRDMITTENIQQQLEQFLSGYLLPHRQYQVTDRWSGIMGMGSEKMPVSGKLPHRFIALFV